MDFVNSEVYKKIFAFHSATSNKIVARESGWLEFKEQFNWLSKDKYAKSMVAFANNKGGYIVFGIKDKPRELVGLQSNNFESTDEAKITAYLNDVFSPEIVFEKFIVEVRSKNIGVLYTHQAKYKPVVCSKNDNDLKESDIFYTWSQQSSATG
jgi:predicted HTH transcriptional regulator